MYDPLLEEDPWVQEYGGRQKAEGKTGGKTEGMRQSIEMIVQIRFPDLRDSVMERVKQLQDPIVLQTILLMLGLTSEDLQARHYLQSL